MKTFVSTSCMLPVRISSFRISCFSPFHIISYRFLFRFTKLYDMMSTHFPFNIDVEYEFKNFEHYFNVF